MKKNSRAPAPPTLALSARKRMSPPAQKPRSPAWSIITAWTASSSRQASSASVISRHMFSVRAPSALGRLSVRRPTAPSIDDQDFGLGVEASLMA